MHVRGIALGLVLLVVPAGACQEQAGKSGPAEVQKVGASTAAEATSRETAPSERQDAPEAFWPQWRGPHRDGISRETRWLKDWRRKKPQVLWRREVGIGYSSVSVAGGRLYTMGHREGKEWVWCLDALTGKPLWNDSYPGKLVDNLHKGGPASTPTLDEKRLYTLGREGQLRCYRAADGKLLWSHLLQKLLKVKLPEWGFSCSPLVVGDAVVDALVVLRAQDGKEVARYPWETPYVTSSTTPIVFQDHIFISTGYGRGCALLKLENDQLRRVYAHNKMANHMNTCVLWQGHLYGIHGNSHARRQCRLVCMEWATGRVRWQQRGFGCGAWMLADGMLIILADDGRLCLVEATPEEFRSRGEVQVLDETCWTVPVLAAGIIYCRNDLGTLVAVDVRQRP